MYREATAEEQKYLSLSGDQEAAEELGRDFAASGYDEAMRALYRKTLTLMQEAAKYTYVSPVEFAILHANIGEKDQAFRWLEKAFEERHSSLNFLKADPQFEPLRSDPRFADLIRRVKEVGASVS